jgi:acetyl-CoA acetyltransferase
MKSERDVVIVDGVRTPFVKSGTNFKNVHVHVIILVCV